MKILKPTAGNVVLLRVEREKLTPAGLTIPESVRDNQDVMELVVVAVGPPREKDDHITYKPGDHVLTFAEVTAEFKLEGKTFCLLSHRDIHSVIEEG